MIDPKNVINHKWTPWPTQNTQPIDGYITDGYGCYWPDKCLTCGAPMQVIRPGDCRCSAECYNKREEEQKL